MDYTQQFTPGWVKVPVCLGPVQIVGSAPGLGFSTVVPRKYSFSIEAAALHLGGQTGLKVQVCTAVHSC